MPILQKPFLLLMGKEHMDTSFKISVSFWHSQQKTVFLLKNLNAAVQKCSPPQKKALLFIAVDMNLITSHHTHALLLCV